MYYNYKNWIYISLINPFKTMKKLKGVFKPLKRYFRITFKDWDYSPILWCSKPSFIQIITNDVMWKDKYRTPRYENPPYIWIHIYKLNLVWYWDLDNALKLNPTNCIDDYWEQALWYLYYNVGHVGDIEYAKKTWPWTNIETNETTWTDKFLSK
jgi:hypothetical protein